MKITENKGVMIGIMVLVIVGSTLTSGIQQMNRRANKVNEEFVIGAQKDGLSISRDLSVRVTRSKNILQIAKNYIPESDQDFQIAQNCIAVLSESKNKSELYEANQNLQAAIDSIYARLLEYGMTDKNLQAIKEEKSVFDNAMNTISYDPYNSLVSDYEKETNTIPGKFFKYFSSTVEYFK